MLLHPQGAEQPKTLVHHPGGHLDGQSSVPLPSSAQHGLPLLMEELYHLEKSPTGKNITNGPNQMDSGEK